MTMPEIKLPSDIPGLHVMTPMEMNRQRFVLTHTVITPGALVPEPAPANKNNFVPLRHNN